MQDASFFRQSAIDHQRQGKFSSIDVPIFTNYTWFFIAILVVLFALGAWLVERNYVRYQTIKGYIQPNNGLLIHRAQKSGRVNQINVAMGDHVVAGQVLLTISALNYDISGLELFKEQSQSLQAQMLEVTRADDRIKQLNELRLEAFDTETRLAKLQIQSLLNAQQEQQGLIELVEKRLQKTKQLFMSGHVSETIVDEVISQLNRLTLQQSQISRDLAAENAKLLRIETELQQLPLELAEKLSINNEKRTLLTQKLMLVDSEGMQVIIAAADGVVDEIAIHVGEEISAGTALINLLPANSSLQGELKIPSYAAGFVEHGQSLYLRYDAYPYQKYGTYKGKVVSVAKTPVSDGRGNYYYNAKIALDEDSVLAHGKNYGLKTGMSFEADVVLSRRTFMEWLLEPLYSLKGA